MLQRRKKKGNYIQIVAIKPQYVAYFDQSIDTNLVGTETFT